MTTAFAALALVIAAAPGIDVYDGPTGGLRVTLKHGADLVSGRELRVTCHPKDAAGKTLFVRGGPQQTDARGQAVWLDLPSNCDCSVNVDTGPNRSTQMKASVRAGIETAVEMVLPVRFTISGQVVDKHGRPAVATVSGQPRLSDGGGLPIHATDCDQDGRFELEAARAGTYELTFHNRWSGLTARVQAVAPSQNLKVTLAPGVYVTGRVRDAEGSVRKYEAVLTNPEFFKETYDRRVVSDGKPFTLGPVPPGEYQVTVTAGGRKQERKVVIAAGAGNQQVDVEFGKGAGLRGLVVDAAGKPMPGVEVTLVAMNERRQLETGPDGTFAADALTAPGYGLFVQKRGFVQRGVLDSVAPLGQTVTLTLDATGRVRGRLVDDKGRPVPHFTIDGQAFDSPSGEFDFEAKREGQLVVVSVRGQGSAVERLPSKLADTREAGTLRWTPSAPVTVTVYSEHLQAPSAVEQIFYAQRVEGRLETFTSMSFDHRTDQDGRISMPAVRAPGVFAVDLMRQNSVEVPPGATAVTLRQKSPFERK